MYVILCFAGNSILGDTIKSSNDCQDVAGQCWRIQVARLVEVIIMLHTEVTYA